VPPTEAAVVQPISASNPPVATVDNDEHEQLRKSREQAAVLQEKIVEDLVEEEQIYQDFEQMGKKRTLQKVLADQAAARS